MSEVETFLRMFAEIRATGVGRPETSFYPAVANLLNGIGSELKPKVLCVFQLRNRGAGMPDAGLFTADQLRKRRQAADDG